MGEAVESMAGDRQLASIDCSEPQVPTPLFYGRVSCTDGCVLRALIHGTVRPHPCFPVPPGLPSRWAQARQEQGLPRLTWLTAGSKAGESGCFQPGKDRRSVPQDPSSRPTLPGGAFTLWADSRSTVRLTSRPLPLPSHPPSPSAPGAPTHIRRLHPRAPRWPLVFRAVGVSQVSSRQRGRPSSPASRRDWGQGCALPRRLPSSPSWHRWSLSQGAGAGLRGECLPCCQGPAPPGAAWWGCWRPCCG